MAVEGRAAPEDDTSTLDVTDAPGQNLSNNSLFGRKYVGNTAI